MEELPHDEERPLQLSHLHFTLAANGAIQFLVLAFTGLTLDGGFSSRMCFHALIGYWLLVGWIALRRREALTTMDAVLIRVGFVLWLPVAVMVDSVVRARFAGGL